MTGRLSLRPFLCLFAASLMGLGWSGCDQIQQAFNGAPAPPPPPVAQPAPPPPPPPPVQAPPAPPNPEEVARRFSALKTHERNDAAILDIVKYPDAASQITELNLGGAPITDVGGLELGKFPNARKVNLQGTAITDKTVAALGGILRLEELVLTDCRISDGAIPEILKHKTLRGLYLARTSISESALASLGELPALEEINFAFCGSITGEGFTRGVKAGGYKALKTLIGVETGFPAKGLEQIRSCTNLEKVSLMDCGVSDLGLRWLSQCSELKILLLNDTPITDRGIAELGKLKKLEHLGVPGCGGVTDKSFNTIKNMKSLKMVDVEGTQCTEAAARLLKSRFLKDVKVRVAGKEI